MKDFQQHKLNCRLNRIEDMMILTMILVRCNANNIHSDILLPKNFYYAIASLDWKKEKDKNLLYSIYWNGYNSIGPEFAEFIFASLSFLFHALIQAFIPDIQIKTGCKSVEMAKSTSKSKVKSCKILVKISKNHQAAVKTATHKFCNKTKPKKRRKEK